MRILVFGAGVLGSLYAARLAETGNDVTILARGSRATEIREHGLVIVDGLSGRRSESRVAVIEALDPDDAYDLVIVLVRNNQVASTLPALAASSATPNVLFMNNNACGFDELVGAIGRQRVMIGFPGAAGTREGHVVRGFAVHPIIQKTTVGEIDGRITPRVSSAVRAFRAAGFPSATSRHIDAWLKTHVALVSPFANAVYLAGGDVKRLARTRDGLVLMVRAVREGFRTLGALGIPVTPLKLRSMQVLPEALLVFVMRFALATEYADLIVARHANAARDEMGPLCDDFIALARRSGVPTPSIDALRVYVDSAAAPMTDRSRTLPVRWTGVIALAGLLGVVGLLIYVARGRH